MTKKQYKVIIDNLDEYSVLRYDGSIVSTEITNKAVAELFCDELNEQDERIQELEDENERLKQEKERYKRLSEIRNEQINNRILTIREFIDNCSNEDVKNALQDLFYSEVNEYDLAKENRKLAEENDSLKKWIEMTGGNK